MPDKVSAAGKPKSKGNKKYAKKYRWKNERREKYNKNGKNYYDKNPLDASNPGLTINSQNQVLYGQNDGL